MDLKDRHSLYERFIYVVLWGVIFALPALDFLLDQTHSSRIFTWQAVFRSWFFLLPFLIIFIVNDWLLAPLFLLKKKLAAYSISAICLIIVVLGVFVFWECKMYSSIHRKPFKQEQIGKSRQDENPDWSGRREKNMGRFDPDSRKTNDLKPNNVGRKMHKRGGDPAFNTGLMLPLTPMVGRFFIALFILGFNVAIKLVFTSIRSDQREKEEEQEKLRSELEYLKYQINPHFLMNTLNNIHALIDIDRRKAQNTILELSKMMRYVLYDSSNRVISLEKEILFLQNYIELMRLRYTDKVNVKMTVPDTVPQVSVPPLLFISFVENAFKHGVSYQQDTMIDVSIQVKPNEVVFRCENTYVAKNDVADGALGIGIENTRKRLSLLFGTNYTLSINKEDKLFKVLLIIPAVC